LRVRLGLRDLRIGHVGAPAIDDAIAYAGSRSTTWPRRRKAQGRTNPKSGASHHVARYHVRDVGNIG